ncbi:MAG: DUF885 domain-containing protein, partial [Gammaproteobacteria bacterium]
MRNVILLAALIATGAVHAENPLPALVAEFTDLSREMDPVLASQRGDSRAATRWPDNSPGAVAARLQRLDALDAKLGSPALGALEAAQALDRDWLRWRADALAGGMRRDAERIAFISGDGFYTVADYAALKTSPRNADEAARWVERIEALPVYYAREQANLQRGIRTGFTQPRITVERAIADMDARLAREARASPLLAPLDALPTTVPDAERLALRKRAMHAIKGPVREAEEGLARFLREQYLPAARTGIGASTLPGGVDWYDYLVHLHTTTALTPAEIHALGESEVQRIRSAMDRVIGGTGFEGGFAEFIRRARTDPRFYVDATRWGEKAAEVAKRADAALPGFFGTLPRLSYGVGPIPKSLESSSAGYLPGSPERGVAGMVVYKPWLSEKLPTFGIAAWVLHEGTPGHHLQIALSQENSAAPEYRRNDDITAFVEGWGLYAEKLGEDMGIYRDPWERFGRLSLEMWRACRLVIDTGIHAMGWSRERAAACLRENSALPEAEIGFELDRYIAWPG